MHSIKLIAAALAVTAAAGCSYRETTDDGSWDRERQETRQQNGYENRQDPARVPGPGPQYPEGGFHSPGPNYPNTGR